MRLLCASGSRGSPHSRQEQQQLIKTLKGGNNNNNNTLSRVHRRNSSNNWSVFQITESELGKVMKRSGSVQLVLIQYIHQQASDSDGTPPRPPALIFRFFPYFCFLFTPHTNTSKATLHILPLYFSYTSPPILSLILCILLFFVTIFTFRLPSYM